LIVEEIIEYVRDDAVQRRIADLRIGLGYTAVMLDDGSCGLAFVFRSELGPKCGLVEEAGNLIGTGCSLMLNWAMDINLAKASVGIALINALLQRRLESFTRKNALGMLDIRQGDTIGMIGYYKPVLEKYRDMLKGTYIFERNMTDDVNMYPDWAEQIYLPRCDVVIITGTTLVNKTLDHVLEMSKNAREIAIMGPTTCLCPEVFRNYGVNIIAGVKVTDPEGALRIASQGGGGPNLGSVTEKLCMRIK
jgi:uncharacterized protein (DUF4213/DUF364 family)